MKIITLLYHDVIQDSNNGYSGFPGGPAFQYKLDENYFSEHLAVISKKIKNPPVLIGDALKTIVRKKPLMLTFDDGGKSAITKIMPLLEKYKLKGHFFITTNFIGQKSFVTKDDIIELRKNGHIIGSHSCSHPTVMSNETRSSLLAEWKDSISLLSDILGEEVITASIPGGYYSRAVAEAASDCGIKVLFTSEPVQRTFKIGNCSVVGRYTIFRNFTPNFASKLATDQFLACLSQYYYWNLKKIAKKLNGRIYLKIRDIIYQRNE